MMIYDASLLRFRYVLPELHLQRFARPEDEGRTEEPTDYRLRKAREDEGKVAKSVEVTSSVLLVFTVLAIILAATFISMQFMGLIREYFLSLYNDEITFESAGDLLVRFMWDSILPSLPVLVVAFVVAILANVLQFGFFFSGKALRWNNKRISFRFGRVFASRQTIVNLVKSVLKVVLVLGLGAVVIFLFRNEIVNLLELDIEDAYQEAAFIALVLLVVISLAMVVLAIPDFFFQRREHLDSLKMSQQEIKDERKETEGDPQIKDAIRRRGRDILDARQMQDVPRADVVITNPTHYAVAILYDPKQHNAPVLLAKGVDLIAMRIKELANENDVPVVEDKPLAQALYGLGQVGQPVPQELWTAIIQILFRLGIAEKKMAALGYDVRPA